jgi:putative mRNA 3-end processing factor
MYGCLRIRFLGGAGEVGRSAILLQGERNILLDDGIKLDHKIEYPLTPGRVDAVVISHAHLDHVGFAPDLYFSSNQPVAFGTAPTLVLGKLLIEDSLKIAHKEHLKPAFFKRQMYAFANRFVPVNYHHPVHFAGNEITMYDAGHICGSSITLIEDKRTRKRVLYTGDLKLSPQTLHEGAEVVESDILITESTYANSEHPGRESVIANFIKDIKETINAGGTALLPCFAVGRAQEVLAVLQMEGLIENTYIDGMALKATEISMEYLDFFSNAGFLESAMANATHIRSRQQRARPLAGGSIVVTTAGMLNGGPILDYMKRANLASRIFLTGYQVEGTNGRKLLEGKPLIIDGRRFNLSIPFGIYDFSAHSGRKDLHDYIKRSNPEKVICVHGDMENSKVLAAELLEEGFDSIAPATGEDVNIELTRQ